MSSLQKRLGQAGGHEQVTATAALAKMNERARPIRLNEITLDLGLQFRLDVKGKDGIDEKHVVDLMHVIADGADTDPVILYRVDKALLMVDGFHRYEAYRRSERKTIPAIVRDGTYQDAEEAAENANLQFKKALGDESKKYIFARRVQRGYLTNGISWQQLSDRAIAAELGVSYQTINNWFNELHSQGVKFLTPSKQEILIQVACDRSVVYGRDGNPINVQAIREANQQRAEAQRQRNFDAQVTAEAQKLAQWRASNVIFRAKFLADMILRTPGNRNIANRFKIDLLPESTPDEHKTFGYYTKAGDKRFTLTTDRENQFIRDFQSHKDLRWYQTMLSTITPATWEQAESQNWDEDMMQQWLDGYRQRQSTPLAPAYGTAQPKNPDLAYQSPAASGRHRLTEVTTLESKAAEMADEEPEVNTNPKPCPFRVGQNVQVIETGEGGIVQATEYVDQAWQIRVELYDGLKTFKAHEIERPFREPVDEALSVPSMGAAATTVLDEAYPDDEPEVDTNPAPCPYQPGDVVKYRPTDGKCELLDAKWDGHVWWLLVRDENGQDWDAPLDQFERVGVLLDSHAPPPAVDGAYWVDDDLEGDGVDNIDEKIQYFDAHPEEASEALRQRYNIPAPSQNGKRQAEMMVEDARSIIPRLVLDTTNATADFRQSILVRWESPKSIQTILENGDPNEISLLVRDLSRLKGEVGQSVRMLNKMFDNINAMIAELDSARA